MHHSIVTGASGELGNGRELGEQASTWQRLTKNKQNKEGWLVVAFKNTWYIFKMKSESIQEILAGRNLHASLAIRWVI